MSEDTVIVACALPPAPHHKAVVYAANFDVCVKRCIGQLKRLSAQVSQHQRWEIWPTGCPVVIADRSACEGAWIGMTPCLSYRQRLVHRDDLSSVHLSDVLAEYCEQPVHQNACDDSHPLLSRHAQLPQHEDHDDPQNEISWFG